MKLADFIGALPEADGVLDYPSNIGFDEHRVRMLDLCKSTGKMRHVHTDQTNSSGKNGTKRLQQVMRNANFALIDANGAPLV